ncbi:MAG: hypothetical protein L3J50_11965, partial [Emcibacter sp.]|nr:hypothetical protein [Emcibacter sp.]
PCIEAMFESKPNLWIMQNLAKRLGSEIAETFDFTMDDLIHHQVSKNPKILKDLKSNGVHYMKVLPTYGLTRGKRLRTKTGKIEIYSANYAKKGLDPLPVYTKHAEVPAGQFRLLVGRNAYFTHGTTANNAYLHELMPENTLWLNTTSAKKLGLIDGQKVKVKSPVGEGTLKLEVTDKIRPDCVYMAHGFGVLSKGQSLIYGVGACDAALIEEKLEPISGNVAMHQTFVEVSPA